MPGPDDTLDALLRFQMPAPMSTLYRAVRVAGRNDARWTATLRLAEGAARYLALVALAQAARTEVPRAQWRSWIKLLEKPGYGGYLALWVQATTHLKSQGGPFLAETAALADEAGPWLRAQTVLVSLRNDQAHREPTLPEERAASLLQTHATDIDTVLGGLAFLAHYPMGTAEGLRRVGTGFQSQWYAALGADERHAPVALASPEGLPDGVLLLDPRTHRALHLAPFFHWGSTEVADGEHLLWLDRLDPSAPADRAVRYLRPGFNVGVARDLATPEGEAPRTLEGWDSVRAAAPALYPSAQRASPLPCRASPHRPAPRSSTRASSPLPSLARARWARCGWSRTRTIAIDCAPSSGCSRRWPRTPTPPRASRRRLTPSTGCAASRALPALVCASAPGDPARYFVMECVEGPSLADLLRERGALPLHEAVEIVGRALNVLGRVQARGVIHRDIKPANILRVGEMVYLIDFGIALSADHTRLTAPLQGVGTPGYLPPEQAVGFTSPASDLFAMARTLFVLVAGRLPRREDERPSEARPDLPAVVDAWYLQATQFDPAARFPGAEAMAAALRAAMRAPASVPHHATSPETVSRPTLPLRASPPAQVSAQPERPSRSRPVAWLGGVALVALVGSGLMAVSRRLERAGAPEFAAAAPAAPPDTVTNDQPISAWPELAASMEAWSRLFETARTRWLRVDETAALYAPAVRFRGSGSGPGAEHIADYWSSLFLRNGGTFRVDASHARWRAETLDRGRREHQGCAAAPDAETAVYLVRVPAEETDPTRATRARDELPCATVRGTYLLRFQRVGGGLRICHDTWSLDEAVCPSCPAARVCRSRRQRY